MQIDFDRFDLDQRNKDLEKQQIKVHSAWQNHGEKTVFGLFWKYDDLMEQHYYSISEIVTDIKFMADSLVWHNEHDICNFLPNDIELPEID